jgi:hypothetical protein
MYRHGYKTLRNLLFPLLDVHDQLHFGMDVAAHLEGSRFRKAFAKILARGSFVGIEQARNEDLVNEFVIVGEGQRLAAIDGDFGGAKRPALLHDGMGVIRESGQGREDKKGNQNFLHFDTT